MRHGGQILIDQLQTEDCQLVFCVPGESFLAALDGLYGSSRIQTIVCRHEGGAAMMAEAYGKLTGRPGICFVTRGPGAANAMSGVHIARQDSTPMILFIGLPKREHRDREAFQEIDVRALFGSMAKWAATIDDIKRIPEYVSRAYHVALSGRPGPVVLGLPEDMLQQRARVISAKPVEVSIAHPGDKELGLLEDTLRKASRPLMIIGGPGWTANVSDRVTNFAERFDLPVAAAFRYQDCFDNRHKNYVGDVGIGINPALAKRIKTADLIISMGPRLGEITTSGYTLLNVPTPEQLLVHIHPGAEELGSVYQANIPIQAALPAFAERLNQLDPPNPIPWESWRKAARIDYEANIEPEETLGTLKLEQVIRLLSEMLPEDTIVTNGAGNYTAWLHRYFQYKHYKTQLAPTAGSMGYGLPAAIAAKLRYPDRRIVTFAGDGCFMMTAQELATAIHYGLPIIIIVVNNQMFGTIRMHQELNYPGRVLGTSLTNPDFATFAKSFGAHGETIEHTKDFRPAFKRAVESGQPAVLELRTDPEALTPRHNLNALRRMASPEQEKS